MRTRVRLTTPFGAAFTTAPNFLEAQLVWPFRDKSTLQLQYPDRGVNSALLAGECEAVFEFQNAAGAWVEPLDSRYRLAAKTRDRLDVTRTQRYDFIALLPFMLESAHVWEPAGLPTDSQGRVIFAAMSPGRILRTLFNNAKARGWGSALAIDFTDTLDSNGAAWAGSINLTVAPEQTLYEILSQLGQQGVVDWAAQGRTLRVFNPDAALGRDLSATVRLAQAQGETAAPEDVDYKDRATLLRVVGDDGKKWDRVAPASPWGRLESIVGAGGVTDEGTAQLLTQESFLRASGARVSRTREFDQAAKHLPQRDYRGGDYVSYQTGTGFLKMRVFSVSLTVGERLRGHAVLGDRFEDALISAARKTNALVIGRTTSGNGTQPTQPDANADWRTPVNVTGLLGASSVYFTAEGTASGRVSLSWSHTGKATDGTVQDIDRFEFQYRADAETWRGFQSAPGADRSLSVAPVRHLKANGAPEVYEFRARAVGANSRASDWSTGYTVTMVGDTTPPPVLAAPVVTVERAVFTVQSNGLGAAGEAMPADYRRTNVRMGTSPTGPWTVMGQIVGAGHMLVANQGYVTRWFQLQSEDQTGNLSAWSASANATATPLVQLPEIQDEINRLEDDADTKANTASTAALNAAKADATTKVDAALAAAKADAATKAEAARVAAVNAAAADATAKKEQAEANAAAAALVIAQTEAAREANEAEAAAKAYADLQASGASADVLAAAKTYADEQAEEARAAAVTTAAADATAKKQQAEATAAADAKTKADAALAAAKADATTKADAALAAAQVELDRLWATTARSFYWAGDRLDGLTLSTGNNMAIVPVPDAPASGSVLRKSNNVNNIFWDANPIPFDPDALYRITFKVRVVEDATNITNAVLYAGVHAWKAGPDGGPGWKISVAGASSTSSAHYFAAGSETIKAADGWRTFTGYFKGIGGATGNGGEHFNPNDPGGMHQDTRYITPMAFLDYQGGNGTWDVGMVAIDVVPAELQSAVVAAQARADKAVADAAAAVVTAATDATTKADAAKAAAISAAAADATAKKEQAEANAAAYALQQATAKAAQAKTDAEAAAATHAQLVANGAKADAIAAAAADATTKANNAKTAAQAAAAADATAKTEAAEARAATEALRVANEKADAARAAAIAAAAADATTKANNAQAAAEAKAATAQSKADTAFTNAATAQSKADTAFTNAATAAGIAAGKSDTLIQPTAPAADMRKATTLWIDTTGGLNTPKRWTTGTTWVAVTDKVATDAAAAAVTAKNAADAAKGVADTALANAATAQTAAGNAQTTANSALSSANSKTRIYDSLAAPSGTGSQTGDYWHQWTTLGAGGKLLASWRWDGSAWRSNSLDAAYLPLVDIGQGTFGTLDGRRLQAKTVAAQSLVVADFGNLAVLGNLQDAGIRYDNPGYSGYTWVNDAATAPETTRPWYLKLSGASAWATFRLGPDFAVQPGDKIYFEWEQKRVSANAPASLNFEVRNGAGSVLSYDMRPSPIDPSTPSATSTNGVWITYSGVATVPAGGILITPQAKLLTAGSMTGEWHFGAMLIRRMSGGKLIVDGEVRTQHLASDAVTADKIKANDVWADTAWLAAIKTSLMTLESSVGEYTTIVDSHGVVVNRRVLQADGTYSSFSAIELGTAGTNRFGTYGNEGQALSSVDAAGNFTAVGISAQEDPIIMGRNLLGDMRDHIQPSDPENIDGSWLASMPRGLVSYGYRDREGISSSIYNEVGTLELSYEVYPYRSYLVVVEPFHIFANAASGTFGTRIRYTDDGSSPSVASSAVLKFKATSATSAGTPNSIYDIGGYSFMLGSSTGERYTRRMLFSYFSGGAITVVGTSGYGRLRVTVYDMGSGIPDTGRDRTSYGKTFANNTQGTTDSPNVRRPYWATWDATSFKSYYGASGAGQNTGQGAAMLKQGYDPSWTGGGQQTSTVIFNSTTLPIAGNPSELTKTKAAALTGANLTKARLRLWGAYDPTGSSGYVRVHWHENGTLPATLADTSSMPNYIGEYEISNGGSREITLPTAVRTSIASGNFRGFTFAARGHADAKYALGLSWTKKPELVLDYLR